MKYETCLSIFYFNNLVMFESNVLGRSSVEGQDEKYFDSHKQKV
jgi:hypothetical protein